MGIAYPQYEVQPEFLAQIISKVEEIKNTHFRKEDTKDITYRPFRPEELNTSLNEDNRTYITKLPDTADATKWGFILSDWVAASPAAWNEPIEIPTGSVYVIFGWIVIDDGTNGINNDAIIQVKLQGVIRQEVSAKLITLQENNALLLLDQVVKATEGQRLTLRMSGGEDALAGDNPIVMAYPMGYRIGLKNQLNVG